MTTNAQLLNTSIPRSNDLGIFGVIFTTFFKVPNIKLWKSFD